jgi:tetratricopeptide (TPR) repeat protein
MLELLRLIREQEPSKPSTKLSSAESLPTLAAYRGTEPAKLTKLVRGELDWIVMKALEKERSRRYEAANEFAMDLQRYLDDEHVLACPPSGAYRLRKFVRRNKGRLTIAGLALFFLVFAGTGIGWMVRDRTAREQEISRDRDTRQAVIKERVTLALAESRRRHHEGQWREALDAAKRAEALAATGESDEKSRFEALEVLGDMQMLANLEEVRARSTTNEAGYDLKEEDSGNARVFREYGIDIDDLDPLEAARRIKARNIRYELAVFLDSWSHVRRRLEELGTKRVGKNWKELLVVARAADPDPWRDRFRTAVLDNDRKALVKLGTSAPISSLPVETVDRLGGALLGAATVQDAASFFKKGQQLHPQDYWITVNLANSLAQLGPQYLDEAIRYYTAAVALRPEVVLSHMNLGDALSVRGKFEEAVACYRRAIELSPKRVLLHNRLGGALERQGKQDEATAAYEEAKRLKAEEAVAACREAVRLKPNDPLAHFNLGVALGKRGMLDDAIAAYQEVLLRNPDILAQRIVNNLSWDFLAFSNPQTRDAKRVVELIKQVMAQDPTIAQNPNPEELAGYASLFLLAGDIETYRQQSTRVFENHGYSQQPHTAYLVARICALAPDTQIDPNKLVQLAERSAQAKPVPHHLHTLGLAHYRAGQYAKAIEHCTNQWKEIGKPKW